MDGRRTVWWSRGLSNVADAVRIVREADARGALRLLASHADGDFPARALADAFWVEPPEASGDGAADWALRTCAERGVDLLMPGRDVRALIPRAAEFAAAGTRVCLPCGAAAYDLLDDKAAFYRDLAGTGLPVPEWTTFSTLEEFDAAWAALRPSCPSLCLKPTVGIYAAGFRRVVEDADAWGCFAGNEQYRIGREEFRRLLGGAGTVRPFMLMRTLEGEERSVDCLAHEGRLVAAVSRVKRGRAQHLETAGPAVEIARALVERHRLNGVVNVQTKDSGGQPYVLEVNPRMAGGMLYSCMSGVALPYWAALLALGRAAPEDVPAPRGGVVAPVNAAVRLA